VLLKLTSRKVKVNWIKQQTHSFKRKYGTQIVTQADLKIEKLYISAIQKEYPTHSILSEESGIIPGDKDYLWIIDPIDGTTNFSMKNPFFNTTIAFIRKNEIIAGVVNAPLLDELYWSAKGSGAFLNDDEISTFGSNSLKAGFHGFCFGGNDPRAKVKAASYYKKSLLNGHAIRQLGSAALELCRIAAGVMDSLYIPGVEIWDVAAGALILEEAGGVATNRDGDKFTLDSKSLITGANETIHKKVMNFIGN